ncbi:type IV pre-pilin leader peptidase, partial [mine drainage metagenome]
ISPRYPLVEALTGLLSAAVAWRFGFGWPALAALVLTWYLVGARGHRSRSPAPARQLTLPLMWIGLLLALLAPVRAAARCRSTCAPA